MCYISSLRRCNRRDHITYPLVALVPSDVGLCVRMYAARVNVKLGDCGRLFDRHLMIGNRLPLRMILFVNAFCYWHRITLVCR